MSVGRRHLKLVECGQIVQPGDELTLKPDDNCHIVVPDLHLVPKIDELVGPTAHQALAIKFARICELTGAYKRYAGLQESVEAMVEEGQPIAFNLPQCHPVRLLARLAVTDTRVYQEKLV